MEKDLRVHQANQGRGGSIPEGTAKENGRARASACYRSSFEFEKTDQKRPGKLLLVFLKAQNFSLK